MEEGQTCPTVTCHDGEEINGDSVGRDNNRIEDGHLIIAAPTSKSLDLLLLEDLGKEEKSVTKSSNVTTSGGDGIISIELDKNCQFPQQPEPVQLDQVSSTASAAVPVDEIMQVEKAATVVEERAAESHEEAMQAVTRAIVSNDDSVKYPANGNNNVNSELQSIPNMDNNMICWEGDVGHLPGSDLKVRS